MRWIKLKWIYAAVSCMMAVQVTAQTTNDVTSFVNPIIGTNGMGHTFPGACYPFGLVQLSPDTDTIPIISTGNINRELMNIVPAINIKTAALSVSAILISVEPDIRIWEIS